MMLVSVSICYLTAVLKYPLSRWLSEPRGRRGLVQDLSGAAAGAAAWLTLAMLLFPLRNPSLQLKVGLAVQCGGVLGPLRLYSVLIKALMVYIYMRKWNLVLETGWTWYFRSLPAVQHPKMLGKQTQNTDYFNNIHHWASKLERSFQKPKFQIWLSTGASSNPKPAMHKNKICHHVYLNGPI